MLKAGFSNEIADQAVLFPIFMLAEIRTMDSKAIFAIRKITFLNRKIRFMNIKVVLCECKIIFNIRKKYFNNRKVAIQAKWPIYSDVLILYFAAPWL